MSKLRDYSQSVRASRRSRMRAAAPERRGTILIAVLVVVFTLGGLVMGLLQIGSSFHREQNSQEQQEVALQLCEAGLAEAIAGLRNGMTGTIGSQADPVRFGNGLFWTTTVPAGNDILKVTAASMIGSARECTVRFVFHYSDSLFDTTIFANRSLEISSNVLIDSFDSDVSTYADLVAMSATGQGNKRAIVQSNSDIRLDSATELHGDAHAGKNSNLSKASNAKLTGSEELMPEDRILPPVIVPPIPMAGNLVASGPADVLPPGDYGFVDIRTTVGSQLTITGPARIVVDDFLVRANSDLILDSAAGPIEFYVLGDLEFRSNSTVVTTDGSATSLTINLAGGAGQEAIFRSNGEVYGSIYGPGTSIDIASNFELFGAVAGEEIFLASNTQIHFDEALRASGTTVRYIEGNMVQGVFPDPSLLRSRRDPFRLLGVDREALRTPSDAQQPAP